MKSFEKIYKELELLFIQALPTYIEKVNKIHNDGIILKPFENTRLDEDCLKHPCFKFKQEETEYSEKDRIIKTTVFTVSLEIKLNKNSENKIIKYWRYIEAIQILIDDYKKEDIIYMLIHENINNETITLKISI